MGKDQNLNNNVNDEDPEALQPFVWDIWSVDNFIPYDERSFVPTLNVADEVWIKKLTAGYSHVAVYIGNSEIVHVDEVEKTGLLPGKTVVARDHISKIASGHVVGHRKTETTPEDQKVIVERALADVGSYLPYVLTAKNCEHRVKHWITGMPDYSMIASTQILDYMVIFGLFGLVGLAVGASIFCSLFDEALIMVGGTIGTAVGFAILGIALKYILTALEHREWCTML